MRLAILAALFQAAAVADAQTVPAGEVARSSVGQAGQRQSRLQTSPAAEPMTRIGNRVANRVQSRLRTRVDANYDPRTDAQSPFEDAAERVRTAGRSTRR